MRFVVALACASLVACGDPLVEVQTVRELRIVAARVEANEAPERSGLRAGEGGRLSWLVLSNEAESFHAAVVICAAQATSRGLPECRSQPFFEAETEGSSSEALSFEFGLPRALADDSEWLATVALCREGRAEVVDGAGRCDGGGKVVEAFYRDVVDAQEANLNPELDDDELRIAGETWTATAAADVGEACDEAESLPTIRRGRDTQISFELGGDDRQRLPPQQDASASTRESLLFAHYFTQPGLERPFSVIEADNGDAEFALQLRVDDDVPLSADGVVAEFTLVMRDERGGADWLRRQVCLRR